MLSFTKSSNIAGRRELFPTHVDRPFSHVGWVVICVMCACCLTLHEDELTNTQLDRPLYIHAIFLVYRYVMSLKQPFIEDNPCEPIPETNTGPLLPNFMSGL